MKTLKRKIDESFKSISDVQKQLFSIVEDVKTGIADGLLKDDVRPFLKGLNSIVKDFDVLKSKYRDIVYSKPKEKRYKKTFIDDTFDSNIFPTNTMADMNVPNIGSITNDTDTFTANGGNTTLSDSKASITSKELEPKVSKELEPKVNETCTITENGITRDASPEERASIKKELAVMEARFDKMEREMNREFEKIRKAFNNPFGLGFGEKDW